MLKEKLGNEWVYFNLDDYLGMLGSKYIELHPDNSNVCVPNDICYAKKHDDGTYEIVPGKLSSALYVTIPDVLDVIATQGFHIIADTFITTKQDFQSYKDKLSKHNMYSIYLEASVDVLNIRESRRGDRLVGSSVHWLRQFDCQDMHDVIINTDKLSVEEVCNVIELEIPDAK